MKPVPWTGLRWVLAELDRSLWQGPEPEAPRVLRVIMTFRHTKPLTSSRLAKPVPPPANDVAKGASA